jgi:hypothetical protein
MSIPASVLTHIEQHGCFSGCYGSDSDVSVCLDPNKSLQSLVVVSCKDCFAKVGVPRTMLTAGTTSAGLADALSRHLRAQRGYTFAFSGYHTHGPGLWLGAAYIGSCGLFLLNGERSRNLGSDLDLLLLAFKHGVVLPVDARMLDAKQFATSTIYVRFNAPMTPIASKQDLLASPYSKQQPTPGFQRVTLAEFLPAARTSSATTTAKATTAAKTLKVGDICPKCGAEVKLRQLLNGTFVGCMC